MESNYCDVIGIVEDLKEYYGYQLPKWYFEAFAKIETFSNKNWPKSGLHNKMKVFADYLYHDLTFRFLFNLPKSEIIDFINTIYYIRVSTLYNYYLISRDDRSRKENKESLIELRKLTSMYLGFVLALCKVKSINPLSIPSVQFIILQYNILFKSIRFTGCDELKNVTDRYWFKREEFGNLIKDKI